MSDYNDLLSLPYLPGKQDCFSLVRTYLRRTYDIRIPNYARPNAFWSDPAFDLFTQNYRRWGFHQVMDQPVREGDVLLIPLLTVHPSHCAVVVSGNMVLHHMHGRLSTLDPLWPKWGGRATIILRHPKVEKTQETKVVQIHEVVDAHLFRDPRFQEALEAVLDQGAGDLRDHHD